MTERSFPSDFLWGVAHAGHQVEGGNSNSDTWFAENVTPTVFKEPSGKACNNWELWREDVDLARSMGVNAYRFSVEWARVEPSEGTFDEAALAHYEAIVDYCLELNLRPVVTFNHFTCPHWFAMKSGWMAADAPANFARYCDKVMERFGDRIAYAVTLNEPNLANLLQWMDLPGFIAELDKATLNAASEKAGVPAYRLANVALPEDMDAMHDGMTAGHLAGKNAIKARRPDLPVGFSLAIMDDVVVDGADASARDAKRAACYERWLELARGDDFLGVQNYEQVPFDGDGIVKPAEDADVNQMGTEVEPLSLAGAARYGHQETGVPILVTEHGMGTPDDSLRAAFIEPALRGLLDLMDEGVPVLGYCHWSLMDNFEWIFGYDFQYGLHEVDRDTFVRTPKPSAGVYSAIARANAVRV